MAKKSKTNDKNKRNTIILLLLAVIVLGAAFFGSHYALTRNRQTTEKKSIELPGLKLYSVQEFDYNDRYSYYLNYPQNDQKPFDQPAEDIAFKAKDNFLNQVESDHNKTGDLNVSYDINFYNDQFLSVDVFIYQTIGGKTTEREETILYDRKDKKLLAIDDLFQENTDYLIKLSNASRDQLKQTLGDAYDTKLAEEGTQPNDASFQHFTVDDQRNLVLVFEPGRVAPEEKGIMTVRLSGNDLADVLKKPYASDLLQVAATAPKPPQKPTQPPSATGGGPIPQADPSGVNCAVAKCIALTFDDGPSGLTTPQLLDTLKANNVKATFFELGIQAQKFPSVTQRVVSEGHVIGNHTYDHKDLEQMPVDQAQAEITQAADIIQAAGGVRPGLVRAPYGDINTALAQTLNSAFIQWNIDPDDWRDRDADIVYQRVMSAAKPGAIVLSHDIYQSTVDAYKRIIPDLISQGYVLVTVPQLLGFGPNAAPGVYFSR